MPLYVYVYVYAFIYISRQYYLTYHMNLYYTYLAKCRFLVVSVIL